MSGAPAIGSSLTNAQRALDPSTTAAELQELAASDPTVHALLARHPNAYPGLVEWISSMAGSDTGSLETPEVGPGAVGPLVAGAARRSSSPRVVVGGALWGTGTVWLVAGYGLLSTVPFLEPLHRLVRIYGSQSWVMSDLPWVALGLVVLGPLLAVRGWAGAGLWAGGIVASVAVIWIDDVIFPSWWGALWSALPLTPTTGAVVAVVLWLGARRAAIRSWLLLLLPVAVWIFHSFASHTADYLRPRSTWHVLVSELIPLAAALLAVILAERITAKIQPARDAARTARREAAALAQQEQAHAQRVVAVQQWQDAWRTANPGQDAPALTPAAFAGGPGAYAASPGGTNGMAIASLVTGILGASVVAVVLGHLALGQIRRTGESGRGLALAGTILGYVWVAVSIVVAIWYFALLNSISSY